MIRALCAFMLVLLAAPLAAQNRSPEGRWALHAGGRTLLILTLSPPRDAAGTWTGTLVEPRRLRWTGGSAGFSFGEVEGPAVERALRPVRPSGTGLMIAPVEPVPGQPDAFRFEVAVDGTGALFVSIPGIALPPLQLVRAEEGEEVSAHWAPGRNYAEDHVWPTNSEMTAIFEADQADRAAGAAIDWSAVTPRDHAREAQTRRLLDAGALASGDDFYHAAFVFQHGGEPNDYLLAHILAVIAAARGRPDATWIAAATLDRYLQNIGRHQVFGTQFSTPRGRPATQEPYDRALVSDALRQALGVPGLADQERQRAEFEMRARAAEEGSHP